MNIIKVSGTGLRRLLAEHVQAGVPDSMLLALERGTKEEEPAAGEQIERWLRDSGLDEKAPVVIETNEPFAGLETCFGVFITDTPFDVLAEEVRAASKGADLVIVSLGESFGPDGDRGLEAATKEDTGARKVLIYRDDAGRRMAFRKALDMTFAALGGSEMPEDIPQNIIEAVRKAAVEGRMTCAAAHDLSKELDAPLALIGRALDLVDIKITSCELGCF